MANITIQEMTLNDFDEVYSFWLSTPGLGLTKSDSREGIDQFLKRNPGLSFVARDGDKLVGAALCGNDGRRGYLHHMAVDPHYRRQGIGKRLVDCCLAKLQLVNITKCHLFVYIDNEIGQSFWEKTGWKKRGELFLYSKEIGIH
jgi:N-acetylglutamate synthase